MNLIPTKVEGTETGRGWWGLTSLDSPVIFTQTDCLRQGWKPEEFSRVFLQKIHLPPYVLTMVGTNVLNQLWVMVVGLGG